MNEQKKPVTEGLSFDELAEKIKTLRAEEVERAELRAEYETALIAAHFTGKGDGSESKKTAKYKATIQYNVVYPISSVDALRDALPAELFAEVTKTKIEFSKSGFNAAVKRLENGAAIERDGAIKKLLTRLLKAFDTCITPKSNKPTVKIELLSEA